MAVCTLTFTRVEFDVDDFKFNPHKKRVNESYGKVSGTPTSVLETVALFKTDSSTKYILLNNMIMNISTYEMK